MQKPQAITFFDLDGTLLNEKSKVTAEIQQAVEQLKKNNVLPIIATGRTLVEIEDIMKDSGINSAIVMNGQYIHYEGEAIYTDFFTKEECTKMYAHVQNQGHELSYYNHQQVWCSNQTDSLVKAYEFIHSKVPVVDPLGYQTKNVNMLLILCEKGDEHYHQHFPEFTFYRNSTFSIDTIRKGNSKGSGVKRITDFLQLTDIPTFAFGDGLNDLALFEACTHKVAMGNARKELKEQATFITDTNTNSGISKALRHFDLI